MSDLLYYLKSEKLCACGHAKSNHYSGRGGCNIHNYVQGIGKTGWNGQICCCTRFRLLKKAAKGDKGE